MRLAWRSCPRPGSHKLGSIRLIWVNWMKGLRLLESKPCIVPQSSCLGTQNRAGSYIERLSYKPQANNPIPLLEKTAAQISQRLNDNANPYFMFSLTMLRLKALKGIFDIWAYSMRLRRAHPGSRQQQNSSPLSPVSQRTHPNSIESLFQLAWKRRNTIIHVSRS